MKNYLATIKNRYREGFALPTVVITSVVLFAVLAAAVGTVASSTTSLDTQYYEGLASDAAESGATQANSCLQANGYVSTWGSNQLTPATNCSGTVISGQSAYVVATPTYRSTYSVAPAQTSGTGTQTATITGTLSLLRTSTGVVWKTFTKTLVVKTGGQIGTTQVVFGYTGGQGAFFGTVGGDGIMRTVGYNGQGQLGNGTYANTLTPTQFQVPSNASIVAGFSNFLSVGYRLYGLDNTGTLWASGYNSGGSLGVGVPEATSAYIPTPQQVLITGKQIRSAAESINNSYFITTDNNVYVAGKCDNGLLGSNYAISGCSDQATPVRANLPTPSMSNSNTIPADIVSDRSNVYVRMAGGAVYGWGAGDRGQLGGDSFAASSNPVKIGTYGDAGQPAATQIAYDGDTLYIVDSTGHVNSLGMNSYGEMGSSAMSLVMNTSTGKCVDNANADGVTFRLYTCNGTPAQKYQLRSDTSIYNANTGKCLDNANADGVTLRLYTCNGTAAQKYVWDPYAGTFYNAQANKCIDNANGDGATLRLYTCNGTINQHFQGYNGALTAFDMSGFSGTIKKIWTDQWSLSALTSAGEVWSAGINTAGQLGNGTGAVGEYIAAPVKFNMPVTATDIYETASSPMVGSPLYQNLYAIGSNGRVYGAGANTFGQLGNGTTSSYSATPVVMSVIDGTNIVANQVQSGFGTTVIFTTSGSVYTVGNNASGQLGDGTTNNSSVPIKAKYVNNLKASTF